MYNMTEPHAHDSRMHSFSFCKSKFFKRKPPQNRKRHPPLRLSAPPQIDTDRLNLLHLDGPGISSARLLHLLGGGITSAPSLLSASNSPESFQVSPPSSKLLRVGHAPPEYPTSPVSTDTLVEHSITPRLTWPHDRVQALQARNTLRAKVERSMASRRVYRYPSTRGISTSNKQQVWYVWLSRNRIVHNLHLENIAYIKICICTYIYICMCCNAYIHLNL